MRGMKRWSNVLRVALFTCALQACATGGGSRTVASDANLPAAGEDAAAAQAGEAGAMRLDGGALDAQREGEAGGSEAGSDRSAPDARADARSPGGDAASNADAGPTSGQWVLGYYAAYQRDMLTPAQIDWSGLTHLVMTRLKTDGSGRVQRDMDIDATNGPIVARELATRAHQNGRKALLMLGGVGEGSRIRASASSANRAAFVTALLTAVSELGYDGLDLDWEDDIDYDLFIALARDLRASPLAPPGLILTVPGYPINGNYQSVEPKIPALVQQLDLFSVMTYHPATAFAGSGWLSWHNCPLTGRKGTTPVTIEDTLSRYVMAGVPRAKLAMGVAFYAICYTGGITAPDQNTENGVSIQGGDNDFPLSALFATGGAYDARYRHWHEAAQVPYLTLPSADARGCRYVSYDDEQSLEAKGRFSRENGYGGIIVWTINQGYLQGGSKAPNALTQALKRGFIDP